MYLEPTSSPKRYDYEQERAFVPLFWSDYSRDAFPKLHLALVHSFVASQWQPGRRLYHTQRSVEKPIEICLSIKCPCTQEIVSKDLWQCAFDRKASARAQDLREFGIGNRKFCTTRGFLESRVPQITESSSYHSKNDSRWCFWERGWKIATLTALASKLNARLRC